MNTGYIVEELKKRGYSVKSNFTQKEIVALLARAKNTPHHAAEETSIVMHFLSDLLRYSHVEELCKVEPCRQQT